ncbi:MAG: hypothetical protein LBV52_07000 [Spirochaetaceae bacterium]|nr:hypothetical protein [Spirochaetaceae bacterium]
MTKKLPFDVSYLQENVSEIKDEKPHSARSWDAPDSWLNNPITIGKKNYRKITRDEIYDDCINRLGCMQGKK